LHELLRLFHESGVLLVRVEVHLGCGLLLLHGFLLFLFSGRGSPIGLVLSNDVRWL
jgi:hypothetical protein